jgi:phosphoribosylformylglycinamidine synthase
MVIFFETRDQLIYAVSTSENFNELTIQKLNWLFGRSGLVDKKTIQGRFIGPRKEMITPWSTNAVEITQNMGIQGITRIEMFSCREPALENFDAMLQARYEGLDQEVFTIYRTPEDIRTIDDIPAYNVREGLAMSAEEITYLESLSLKVGRKLTDSEIFGFSQVNSEHCRHKIFNGTFIIDGMEQELSLFQLIKLTTKTNPNRVVSAYKDNCAFLSGPPILQFSPMSHDKADFFSLRPVESVISLKAETHNFPTTVEPFNGAATGTGGEIRDRIAGGRGAFPLAGTAVYMTAYPRLQQGRKWETSAAREWLYQTPEQILIKASNGASDFGNKFGQPLICGSLFTFEYQEDEKFWAFDKVIMLAGGIGFTNLKYSHKDTPEKGDKIVLLGGDNYRIGMGGGAVSSVSTGEYGHAIELNAVQRSNPEMQKRVSNAIRALAEEEKNPIVSIHDHGAGGHLNCFSELVESSGGTINIPSLPVGDPTLSDREIIGNESQERMGLIMKEEDTALLRRISERERAPMYIVGQATGDDQFTFLGRNGINPIDLRLEDIFGNPPKTLMKDETRVQFFRNPVYDPNRPEFYLDDLLQMEAVACKDWLTNKVDRSVTGLVARQQTCGSIQLPLNDLAVSALDYTDFKGIATSIGHAPAAGVVNAVHGTLLSISEALTNIIWAPIQDGIRGISLSANWMWPCRVPGEDARLYAAVKAASDFAIALGINIPTGKDSLSMTQKYKDGSEVISPGTVIISAAGEVNDFRKVVEPVIQGTESSSILYIDLSRDSFKLGGSSFAQSLNALGNETPTLKDAAYFARVFNAIQHLVSEGAILAGHDVSAGGLLITLLEMCFPLTDAGMKVTLDAFEEKDVIRILYSENPAIVVQVHNQSIAETYLSEKHIDYQVIGKYIPTPSLVINKLDSTWQFDVHKLRDTWFTTSYLLDRNQCGPELAAKRRDNFKKQPLRFTFNGNFTGKTTQFGINPKRMVPSGIKSAIIREKGVNGDREMAYMMYLSGLDVKDVHMTDLISGRETLDDVNLVVFVGGFSNSDVLGSAKGWAGAFLYNEKARNTLLRYYERKDTLSLGVCNGCQLMVELDLVNPGHEQKPHMEVNDSRKFESAFLNVDIPENKSVMLSTLAGSRLGIWVAHGEGKFVFPHAEEEYNICMKFSYDEYPGNPNGSVYSSAGICSDDGRHLAIMPHFERAVFPWNWACYPRERSSDEISPWIEAFINAKEWIMNNDSRLKIQE